VLGLLGAPLVLGALLVAVPTALGLRPNLSAPGPGLRDPAQSSVDPSGEFSRGSRAAVVRATPAWPRSSGRPSFEDVRLVIEMAVHNGRAARPASPCARRAVNRSMETVAVFNDRVLAAYQLQYDQGEGACLDAMFLFAVPLLA